MNQFYDFTAVQLLPSNTLAYVQVTETPEGINLEDWTVNVVDLCSGEKVVITNYFAVKKNSRMMITVIRSCFGV